MRKLLHIIVVLFFGVNGLTTVLDAFGVAVRWGMAEASDRYFGSGLDFVVGLALFAVAFGLYRRDNRARILAISVSILGLFGLIIAALAIGPLAYFRMFIACLPWVLVIAWLCWPSVRTEFATTGERARVT